MYFIRAVLLALVLSIRTVKCYEITTALENLLKNFENISAVSTDNWFGLSLAEGLLRPSLRGREVVGRVGIVEYRKSLLERIKNIKKSSVVKDLKEMPPNKRKILKNLVKMRWGLSNTPTHSALINYSAVMPFEDYLKIVNDGSPSRKISDFCLAQIGTTKSCTLNEDCVKLLLSKEDSYGYHRTHQILILLLLTNSKCNRLLPMTVTKKAIFAKICSKIYSEVHAIFSNGIPTTFRDLFLEQVLLCSIGGFTEFLQRPLIASILSWQNDDGCFSLDVNDTEDKSCTNHITSLALTFLSNLIRIAS